MLGTFPSHTNLAQSKPVSHPLSTLHMTSHAVKRPTRERLARQRGLQGDEPSSGLLHEVSLLCRWSPILPKPLRMLTAPAAYGLQAVRTATWVAAILMTAVGLRAGCFSLVDASLLAAQRYISILSPYAADARRVACHAYTRRSCLTAQEGRKQLWCVHNSILCTLPGWWHPAG